MEKKVRGKVSLTLWLLLLWGKCIWLLFLLLEEEEEEGGRMRRSLWV
jgi:K+ transporter